MGEIVTKVLEISGNVNPEDVLNEKIDHVRQDGYQLKTITSCVRVSDALVYTLVFERSQRQSYLLEDSVRL